MPTSQRRRTVFDLSPQELQELYRHDLNVSATVPPRRPVRSPSDCSYSDYAFDLGIYDRYRNLHARAKSERSAWLKDRRISHKVAEQAALTRYNPYALADRLGCVAPHMPEGYAEALAAWRKPPAKAVQQPLPTRLTLQGGMKGFSF